MFAFCLCTLSTNYHFSNSVHFLKFVQCKNSSGQVKQRKCSYFCDMLSKKGFCTDYYLLIFQIQIFIFLTVYYCLNFILYIKWLSGLKSLYSLYFRIILPIFQRFSEVAENAKLVIFHRQKSCQCVPIGRSGHQHMRLGRMLDVD